RVVHELLGEMNPARASDGAWRRADVLDEEARQLPRADAEALREIVDALVLESAAFDQSQGSRHRARGAVPGGEIGCDFRTASQARAESGLPGRGGRGEELDVRAAGRSGGTDGTAVHTGRPDANEQPAVESRVTRLDDAVARV